MTPESVAAALRRRVNWTEVHSTYVANNMKWCVQVNPFRREIPSLDDIRDTAVGMAVDAVADLPIRAYATGGLVVDMDKGVLNIMIDVPRTRPFRRRRFRMPKARQ